MKINFLMAMTGLHVLGIGEVEANLVKLNQGKHGLPLIGELIARKLTGGETGLLTAGESAAAYSEAKKPEAQLDQAFDRSPLPDEVRNLAAIDDFLVRARLQG